MQLRKIVKVLLFAAGVVLALAGAGILAMAASGSVIVGRYSAYATGSGLLLIAAPCIALLFSIRFAQILGLVVLLAFAIAALWLAFWSTVSLERPWLFQVAAIVFAVLAISRVGLFLRNNSSAQGI
jgi:hypothetical protein